MMEPGKIKLGITRIAVPDFAYSGIERAALPEQVMWKFGTKSLADPIHRRLGILFTTWVHATEDSNPFLQLTVEMVFDFETLSEFITKEGEVFIPSDLQSAILGIVVSTTRGILFTKMMGTSLEGLTLPLIDPTRLVSLQAIAIQVAENE